MTTRTPGGRVVVVDFQGGNLASAARALEEAARRNGLAAEIHISADPERVRDADRIVLPGQGAFADCARGLSAIPGLREALDAATGAGTPFLGICVGMQLMAERGLEYGETPGLGWIDGEIARMEAPGLRLPQMGWNELECCQPDHPLLSGLRPGDHGYFVHSFALRGFDPAVLLATAAYGGAVPAIVCSSNRAGTQFHVEKSQEVGLRFLGNFLRWNPSVPAPGKAAA